MSRTVGVETASADVTTTGDDPRLDRLLALVERLTDDRSSGREAELTARIADLRDDLRRVAHDLAEVRQLVGPFAAAFPDGSMLCQTIHGVKYFVDPDDLIIAPQMVIYRQWEAWLSEFFQRCCTPDTVFVDVGANFGYFTCLAGSLIGRGGTGRVDAFEPNPKLASLLRRNVEINWSMAPITIHPVAVADEAGVARLSIPAGHGANATLSELGDGSDATVVAVETGSLDDMLPKDLKVDLLKIDVEGHELKVLRGASALIARSPDIRIVMEWSQDQMREAGIDAREVTEIIAGFACYDMEAPGDPLDNPRDIGWLMAKGYANILLTKH